MEKHSTEISKFPKSASGRLNSDQEPIKGSCKGFKIMLAKLFPQLVEAFSAKGEIFGVFVWEAVVVVVVLRIWGELDFAVVRKLMVIWGEFGFVRLKAKSLASLFGEQWSSSSSSKFGGK
nr:probable ubiquitin-conjugating enzyme E2 24 [Ipomoea batatas]